MSARRALAGTAAAAAAVTAVTAVLAATGGLGRPAAAQPVQTAAASATAQVALTPPMGYNTWYEYHGPGNEAAVLAEAQALVSTGLAAAGYVYVNLDDGWLAPARTPDRALTWNPALFPHGLPWLAGQLHSMGLKFGIYEAIGNQTCQRFPGSWAHYALDAQTFASWGVDFVKIDECLGLPTWMTPDKLAQEFQEYGTDLRAANPNVVYSEELPVYTMPRTPGTFSPSFLRAIKSSSQFANMWRVTADERTDRSAAYTILGHLDADSKLHGFAGPGHWNDLDMLIPGVPKFHWNFAAEQAQADIWAMEASPLIISANVATLTPAELGTLKNPVMISIDRSGPATRSFMSGKIEAVFKNYAGGGKAVMLANRGTAAVSGTIPVPRFGMAGAAKVFNVWAGTTHTMNDVPYRLAPGQAVLFIVS